ncbi:caspase family protein [Nocardia sp. NPDC048505]|uniref:caspase, EACC1-associated type n=1 Tax=Nocardia sp. NPDC048505 TaxID=3155756 RepID=UPI003409785D
MMSQSPLDEVLKASVVLMGASRFPRDTDSLPELRGVVANVVDLERLLSDERYVGIGIEKIHRILDEEPPHIILERIADIAADATETLIVYYAGHGLLADNGELLLTGPQSTYHHAARNSTRWEALKSCVLKSHAKLKIVILDCCFSGQAIGMGADATTVLAQLEISGSVVLTASPKNSIALAPSNARRTTFTDCLLSTIESGIAEAGPTLDVDQIFAECTRRMRAIQAPEPQILATGMAGKLPLCHNVSEAGMRQREVPAPTAAAAQRRGLNVGTLEKISAAVRFAEEVGGAPAQWQIDVNPERFAENVATILTATIDEVNPSPDEIAVAYAALLLTQVRLDRAIQALPSIATMRENNSWPREFIAAHAATERLVERSVDPHSREPIRAAVSQWIAGHALSTTTTGWQDPEVVATASRFADLLTRNLGDREHLAARLLVEAERIQRSIYPTSALTDSLAYTSIHSGRVEYLRWHMVYELGTVLREMHFDVYRYGRELVEQLGIVAQFEVEPLKRDLQNARWALAENGDLVLVANCFDPAVEEALRSYVEEFRRTRDKLPNTRTAECLRRFVLLEALADGVGPRLVEGRPAYRRPITRLTMNSGKIRQLLMGEELYGEPRLAMREMYQNALDACRYRELRHTYLSQRGVPLSQWTPAVKFESIYSDSGSLLRLDCIDNGVGMREAVLENCFLNAGTRFVETATFIDEQASWLEQDPTLRLTPNSTFGIGAFSYFMLADAVEVLTRPQAPDGSFGDGLRLLINAGSGVARVFADDSIPNLLPEGGTAVRLHLRPEYRSVSRLQLRNFIDEFVVFAPMQLEISEGTENVVRAAGELSPESPSSHTAAWVDGESKAWWASYEAPVLADGLLTPAVLFGTMATLHGDHKPMLRVDRNDVVHWDVDWVLDRTAGAAESLANWDGLSLRWLWSFSEAYPRYGKALFERIEEIRPIIPLGQSKYWGRDVDIRKVGCFPGDKYLVSGLGDNVKTRYPEFLVPEVRRKHDSYWGPHVRFPACLRPWRRRVWLECLPELFEGWTQSNDDVGRALVETIETPEEYRFPVWEPETLQGIPNPDPVDAVLLASQPSILNTSLLWDSGAGSSTMVDVVALIHGAARTQTPLGECVQRLAKFTRFALLRLPAIAPDSLDYIPDQRDCQLVTALGEAWSIDRTVSVEDFLGLVPVSQELSLSLAEACEALERLLARLGADPPKVSQTLGSSSKHVPSAREVRFFGFDEYDHGWELRYGRGTRAALMRAAGRADMGPIEIVKTIARYAPLGMDRYLRSLESVDLGTSDEMMLKGWSANFDERQPWIDEEVFRRGFISDSPSTRDELLGHALFFAVLEEKELEAATRAIVSFPGLTDEQRSIDDLSIPSIVPTELDVKLMRSRVGDNSRYQDKILDGLGQRSLVRRRFSPLELKLAAQGENVTLDFTFERLRHFEYLGVRLPECDAATLDAHQFTDLEMELLTTEDHSLGAFGNFPDRRDKKPIVIPIPPQHVMTVAAAEHLPLGAVVEALDGLAPLGVLSGCGPLPAGLDSFVPGKSDVGLARRLAREPMGMAICRAAQEQENSIGYIIDNVSTWAAWLLNLDQEECISQLEVARRFCGDLIPVYSDVSFYCAVGAQAAAKRGRFGRFGALVLAAQANTSVRTVIDKFETFETLLRTDAIDGEGLGSCPDYMAAVVPDSLWILAASDNAVVGRYAEKTCQWLGVTEQRIAAARQFVSS